MQRGGPIVTISTLHSDEGDELLEFVTERLRSFKFIDRDRKVDRCEMQFRNTDRAMHDNPALREGQKLLVDWGWPGDLAVPRRMVVRRAEGNDPVTVICHDESVVLDRVKKHQQWRNSRDSDAATAILNDAGFEGLLLDVAQTSGIRRAITQNTSDARMLHKLAMRNGFRFWIDAAGAHFRPRNLLVKPVMWFTWRGHYEGDGQIIDPGPKPEVDFSKDIAKIRVAAIDPLTHKVVEATRTVDDELETLSDYIVSLGKEHEVGDPDNLKGARQARISRSDEVHIGFATQEEVEVEADRRYADVIGKRYKMELPIKGEPRVGAKMLIGLRNYADAYDGLYYVKEATTEITPGSYKMSLSCIRDATGKLYLDQIKPVTKKKNTETGELTESQKAEMEKYATTVIGPNNQPTLVYGYKEKGNPDGKLQGYDLPKTQDELKELVKEGQHLINSGVQLPKL